MPPVCLNTPICLDAPVCLDAPICLDIPICLDAPYVWITSCMCGCPHMFGHPPVCLDVPHMFGYPLYVWTPLCLDAPCVCLEDVWMPTVHINTKKACFVRLRGCPYAPYTFGCPHMFGHPNIFGHYLYVWMSLIPLDAPYFWGESKHTGGSQTYGEHQNIQGGV